jgi:hypothetical protein
MNTRSIPSSTGISGVKPGENADPVEVTDRPLDGAGKGVYQITVKIDDQRPGSSVVRTIQHHFAFQSE